MLFSVTHSLLLFLSKRNAHVTKYAKKNYNTLEISEWVFSLPIILNCGESENVVENVRTKILIIHRLRLFSELIVT